LSFAAPDAGVKGEAKTDGGWDESSTPLAGKKLQPLSGLAIDLALAQSRRSAIT
jgi:hypothetical protein